MMRKSLVRGFTLLELIIVIVIVGILATMGMVQYYPAKERALGKEAITNLKLIAAAEKIYYMEEGRYYPDFFPPDVVDDVTEINGNLSLFLTETNWSYSIYGVKGSYYLATAERQGDGGYLYCNYTIDNNDADGEPDPNGSCP